MPKLGLRAYAKHRGVSLATVQDALKTGRISLVDGKIETEQADHDWDANAHPGRVAAGVRQFAGKRGRKTAEAKPNTGDSYAESQRKKAALDVRLAQLKVDEQEGRLISADAVAQEWTALGTAIRDSMLALPTRLAGKLASMTSERDIAQFLRSTIRAELSKISVGLTDAVPERSESPKPERTNNV